jgi:NDP-4-keto-2,6-dideoxyhexose 3-C-methyltransferase
MSSSLSTIAKTCRVCHSPRLEKVLSLGNQYVSDFVSSDGKSPQAPLELARCQECGLVQLRHTFSRPKLYQHYWYRSGISRTMQIALADIVAKTSEVAKPREGDLVLDVGCNDGTLLRSYRKKGLFLVGFEPAENLVGDARKGTNWIFNDFFGARVFKDKFGDKKAKIITSVAMFYDLDDPNSFVSDVKSLLASDGVWTVQQNYLATMLEQNGFDNIGHEHLEYYSLGTMRGLLRRHGLDVFDAETNDVNGGSFRTLICHQGRYPVRDTVVQLERYEGHLKLDENSTYEKFAKSIESIGTRLHEFVESEVRTGKKVYVYGASNRGNTILQYCRLDHSIVQKATDANSEKWGRKTVGTLIPIISKQEARKDRPDYFLVLPHHFFDEIRREEDAYLQAGGRFILPLPTLKIVSREGEIPL